MARTRVSAIRTPVWVLCVLGLIGDGNKSASAALLSLHQRQEVPEPALASSSIQAHLAVWRRLPRLGALGAHGCVLRLSGGGNKVETTFRVRASSTQQGDAVVLLGGGPALHNWNKSAAIALRTTKNDFPWWEVDVLLQQGDLIEFKFAVRESVTGMLRWEPVPNRQTAIVHRCDEHPGLVLSFVFGDPAPPLTPTAHNCYVDETRLAFAEHMSSAGSSLAASCLRHITCSVVTVSSCGMASLGSRGLRLTVLLGLIFATVTQTYPHARCSRCLALYIPPQNLAANRGAHRVYLTLLGLLGTAGFLFPSSQTSQGRLPPSSPIRPEGTVTIPRSAASLWALGPVAVMGALVDFILLHR